MRPATEAWFARPFWTPVHWKGWVFYLIGLPLMLAPFMVSGVLFEVLSLTGWVSEGKMTAVGSWFALGAFSTTLVVVIGLNVTARKHLR